jgi:hypothetical protein
MAWVARWKTGTAVTLCKTCGFTAEIAAHRGEFIRAAIEAARQHRAACPAKPVAVESGDAPSAP